MTHTIGSSWTGGIARAVLGLGIAVVGSSGSAQESAAPMETTTVAAAVIEETYRSGPGEPLRSSLNTITQEELLEHASYLADDALEGREAGAAGGQKAGDYLIEQLRTLGLIPAGPDDEYVQACGPNMRNILAKLPGSDPQLADETVIIGAHYDHVGFGPRRDLAEQQPIYNGANDNASGVAGVLEIAEAMTALPTAPRRTILFAFWDGEEKGFIGSRFFVKHPTVPLDRIVFVIALDMIGRMEDDRFVVWGTGTATGLREMITRHNVLPNLELEFRTFNLALSDHQPFFLRGIPVLLPSTGLFPELHRPEDDVGLLNPEGIERAAQLVHGMVHDLAHRDDNFTFADMAREESSRNPARVADLPTATPEDATSPLGFTYQREPREPNAWIVVHVDAASPAGAAGLQVADRVYRSDGLEVVPVTGSPPALEDRAEPARLLIERNGRYHALQLSP